MKRLLCLLCLCVFSLLSSMPNLIATTHAGDYAFVTIDHPDAPPNTYGDTFTFVNGVNDSGQIVGRYNVSVLDELHGFIYDGINFTPIDFPGVLSTIPYDINDDGYVVGDYFDGSMNPHGFIFDGSNYQTVDYPGVSRTKLRGINDAGHISGFWEISGGGVSCGFLYDGSTFTPICHPDATYYTNVNGINDSDYVVGQYRDDSGTHGFLYDGSDFTTIDYPGASKTFPNDINNANHIVGMYWWEEGGVITEHGFLYDGSDFTTIDYPGATTDYTDVSGINDSEHVVGTYSDDSGYHGFVASPVQPGDIVVLEQGTGNVEASVFRVDPVSGVQTLISQGGLLSKEGGENPNGFAYDTVSQRFLVVDRKEDLVGIDLDGSQTLISSNLPTLGTSSAIAIEKKGTFVITDTGSRVLRFNPSQGTSSVITENGFLEMLNPWAVQIDTNGDIIVSALSNTEGLPSRLVRIDPVTGAQSLIAEDTVRNFRDFAILENTAFMAMSLMGNPSSDDIVVALDMQSGDYVELVTGLERVLDVDLDSEGRLIILDQCLPAQCGPGTGAVYRRESSGQLTLLSSNGFMDAPGRQLVIPPADTDGDGIPNDEDACPTSDLRPTVVIDSCDSGVANTLFDDGCTISDNITDLANSATNHGKFTSAVAHYTNDLKKGGVISGQQKGAIQSCAGQASNP